MAADYKPAEMDSSHPSRTRLPPRRQQPPITRLPEPCGAPFFPSTILTTHRTKNVTIQLVNDTFSIPVSPSTTILDIKYEIYERNK